MRVDRVMIMPGWGPRPAAGGVCPASVVAASRSRAVALRDGRASTVMTLLIGGSVESRRAGRARGVGHLLAALGLLVACTEPNAPDPSSPLGSWTYRFVASTAVAGQEIKCYEDGVVSFVREPSNDISGFSGVVHSNCVPVGFVSPRSGRVPV